MPACLSDGTEAQARGCQRKGLRCSIGFAATGTASLEDGNIAAAPIWLTLAYLTLLGSIVAFSAYLYLLKHVRPAAATSYAYVNPVVAVLLGISFAGERIGAEEWLAMTVIVCAWCSSACRNGDGQKRLPRRSPLEWCSKVFRGCMMTRREGRSNRSVQGLNSEHAGAINAQP